MVGAANPYHAACARRVSAARPGLPSGEVVTELQSDSSRTDSPVRVRHAQPAPSLWGMSVARILATFPRLNETTAGDGDLASAPEDLLAGSGLDRQPLLSHRACADIGRAVCVPETQTAPGTYQKNPPPAPRASCAALVEPELRNCGLSLKKENRTLAGPACSLSARRPTITFQRGTV